MAGIQTLLCISQGATFSKQVVVQDANSVAIDITSWDARMQIRATPDSTTILADLTVGNSKIVLTDPTNGELTFTLTDSETSALSEGDATYDLEVIDTLGVVDRILEGPGQRTREVTR